MSDFPAANGRYWWVNQNQTHVEEIRGGFLWSPKRNANGARNQFYDNMLEVSPGDLVFSYFGTKVQAVGVAASRASQESKPTFRTGGDSWSDDGWYVEVDFQPVPNPVRPKDFIHLLRPHLPSKYSPLRSTGDGLQSVYLAEVPVALAQVLLDLTGAAVPLADPAEEALVDDLMMLVREPHETLATEAQRLAKARLGQGIFRSRVRLWEDRCRVTGVTHVHHLRASHIKPWRASTDREKLDGANGLLLAPHVDHLFDRGWISFEDDGRMLVSSALEPDLLDAWALGMPKARPFRPEQAGYLEYHRQEVLQR